MKKIYALVFILFIALTGVSQTTYTVNYLVVAGGGGGDGNWGGGGGAGGVLSGTDYISNGSYNYTITVGAGGSGNETGGAASDATNGSNSVFNSHTAIGGGGGGGATNSGLSGGSGGGGAGDGVHSGGAGTSGQGNSGGTSQGYPNYSGGGGGGAGSAGSNAGATANGGNGGNGVSNSITGSAVIYGGGGGGGGATGIAGTGGSGGGGTGRSNPQSASGQSGTNGLGGGGGGVYGSYQGLYTGGDGGSGVVVLSFPTGTIIYTQTGGTVSSDGAGNTVITYNSSGTFNIICSPLTLTFSPSSPAFCIGGSTTITASGASTYTWANSTGLNTTSGASVIANPATTTVYTISGANSGGCTGTQTVAVTVNPLPNITTSPSNPIVMGGQGATITASGASTYTWSPSTNLNTTTGATVTAIPQITKSYTVTGTSSAGCVNQTALSVGVELWQQTADTVNAPIYYGGKLGIGNTNPQAALDVTGNTKVSGILTAATLSVTGGASFDSLDAGKRLSFGGGQSSLGFIPHTSSKPNIIYTGNQPPPSTLGVPCDMPQNLSGTTIYNPGRVITYGLSGNLFNNPNLGYVITAYDGENGLLESGGNNAQSNVPALLLNFYCGADVGICNNGTSTGGLNGAGGVVGMGQNVTIGNPNFNVHTALNINTNATTTSAISVQNGSNNVFNVANNGSTFIGANNNASYAATKMLNVNGDVCFANYVPGGGTHSNDGASGLEILGNNGIPTDRGISVEADPNGDFNFYIDDWQAGSTPAEFNFKKHNPSNGVTNLMTLNASGQLSLGHSSAGNNTPAFNNTRNTALLHVNGDIVVGTGTTANIYVTQIGWADFVFDENYKLMPLTEVENFYKTNHHLPNVPTQKDIQEQGNNLGQTDVVLLQKIEENTLYIVELKKQLDEEKKLREVQQQVIEALVKKLADKK